MARNTHITHSASIGRLSNSQGDDWEYTRQQLSERVRPVAGADITVAIINAPLEGNYYLHHLDKTVAVLSLYEMAEIAQDAHFTIEQLGLIRFGGHLLKQVEVVHGQRNRAGDEASET